MRRFNKGEWVWFILLVGWALYLLHLLTKGSIVSFIHPKRIPLMWGTLIGILILAFYQSTKLFTIPSRKTVFYSYLPMGFILLCGVFTLTSKETDRISAAKPQLFTQSFNSSEESKEVTSAGIGNNETIASDEEMPGIIIEEPEMTEPDGAIEPNIVSNENDGKQDEEFINNSQEDNGAAASDKIILNDENYTQVLSDIEENPDQYIGKKIALEGFVYRDQTFGKDDFVVARMFMVCCAADAQITGLMATWNESSTLKDKQWVRIEGVLQTQTYTIEGQENFIPIIHIVSATKLKTPENQYVYY